jgi:creatinine amidohydrolase/Fe(II)-dependent formamide hydrolase-like protein
MDKKKTILIPVGCMEGHGVLPPDTDTLIARGFCHLVQKMAGVRVTSQINDGFCPTTCRLRETKTNSFLHVFTQLRQTVAKYHSEGFYYLVFVNIHNGNDTVLRGLVEDYFQETGHRVLSFNPYKAFAGELDKKYFPNRDNSFKEISLYLASRELMGLQPLALSGPAEDEEAGRDPLLEQIRKDAVVGFSYTKPSQHIAWRNAANAEIGIQYLNEVAKRFVSLMQDFKLYVDLGSHDE